MRGTAETPDLILSGEIGVNKTVNTESLNIYENGNYTPPAGVDGYDDIHVDVRPVIDQITIRENGKYEASGEVDGYSPVVVNVPQSAAKVYAKNINANGNYYPDAGYDGFSQVSVNVPATPLRPLNVTENGEYNPPTGEGYSKVVVDVPTDPEIESITITENGTYTAPTGVDGYSPVIVNVPQPEDAYYIKDMTPGAIASFDDGADMVLPSLTASIVPVQSGSGDPSPTNERPITGWTGCNIPVRGINQWDEEWELGLINSNNGSDYPSNNNIRSKYIPIKSGNYYFKTPQNCFIFGYDKNKNYIGRVAGSGAYKNSLITITDTNCAFIRFYVDSSYGTTYNNDISINYPSTDTEYHAYSGTTTTIPFTDGQGQSVEVFGGSVDVVNGGEQPCTKVKIDLGSLNYTYYSGNLFTVRISDLKPVPNEVLCDALCSIYVAKKGNEYSSIDCSFVAGFNNSPVLAIHDSRFTDATAFKTAIAGQEIVYELATPTTFYTQPTSIKSLDGENNVSASTGDVLSGSYFSETPA